MSEPRPVNLVDERTGEVVNVDEADLPKLGSGYRIATPEEVSADLERQQYGEGFGNEAAAFGEGALSGATLGLSDVAAKSIAPEYAAELAKRREYNPTAATAGEVTGMVAPALLTGGESLLAKGVATVGAPARGLMAAGEVATATAGRMLGTEAATTVLGQAVRQAGATAVGGAVEGALYGAAKQVTSDYLTDQEITAERVLTGVGTNAVWGGALGGAMGFGSGLLIGGARKAKDLWAKRSAGQSEATALIDDALNAEAGSSAAGNASATGGSGSAADATAAARGATGASVEAEIAGTTLDADQRIINQLGYKSEDQLMADLSTQAPAEVQSALDKVKSYAAEADAAKRFKTELQDTTQSIVDDIELIRRNQDELQRYINRGQKRNAARDLAEVAPPEWSADKTQRILSSVEETNARLAKMREDAAALSTADHAAIKSAIETGDEIIGRLRGFSGRGKTAGEKAGPIAPDAPIMGNATADDIADVFDLHDKYKSALGRAQGIAKRGNGGNVSTGAAAIQREYMGHRALLEAEDLYGKGIAEMQRVTNAAETQAIRFSSAWDQVAGMAEGKLTKAAGEFNFEKLAEADFDKVRNFIQRAGDNPQDERTFIMGLQRQADLQKVKSDFYAMPPEAQAKAIASQQAAERVIARYKTAKNLKITGDRYLEALSSMRELPMFGQQVANLKLAFGRTASLVSDVVGETTTKVSGGGVRASARGASDVAVGASSAAAADAALGVQAGSASGSAVRAGLKAEGRVSAAAKGVIKWLRDAASVGKEVTSDAARAVARASKAKTLLGVALLADNPASYERVVRNIGSLQNPNSDERKTARANLYPLRKQNPELADALESKTQQIADFLAQKAGELYAIPRGGDPFGHLRKARHEPAKAAKLARYIEAATDPRTTLERISQGQFLREDIEVLQTLYPRVYQRVVEDVLLELGSVKDLPPYAARLRLGHLLNAPTDPSMRPDKLATIQAVAASGVGAQASQEANGPVGEPVLSPGKRREPRLGGVYATQTDAQSVLGGKLF